MEFGFPTPPKAMPHTFAPAISFCLLLFRIMYLMESILNFAAVRQQVKRLWNH
jgi:hypothetical protein